MLVSEAFRSARPLTQISSDLFLAHAVVTIVAAAILGPSTFLSWAGLTMVVALDCILYVSLRTANKTVAPILLTTAWFILLFFLPRLTAFQLFPAHRVTFVALEPFSQFEVTNALAFIIAGYLAVWAGLQLASRMFPTVRPPLESRVPILGILAYSVLAVLASFYVNFYLDVSVYSVDSQKWGSRSGWIAIVFNIDVALLAAITWLILHARAPTKERVLAYLIILACLLLSLVTGSRGGGLRIMLLIGLAAIAIHSNPVTTLNRVVAIVVISLSVSSVLYPLGTLIRFIPASGDAAAAALTDQWTRLGSSSEQKDTSDIRQAWSQSALVNNVTLIASPILTRLGLVDYPILIINRAPDQPAMDRYMSVTYGLKNFANNMVPGEIFAGYDIMTSRVFTMVYRGHDEKHVRSHFLSEPWTLWGYSWLKGGFVGGLVIIVLLSIALQSCYALLQKVSGPTSHYTATTYLFITVIGGGLQLFGIDHALTITAHFAIALTAMYAICAAMQYASRIRQITLAG